MGGKYERCIDLVSLVGICCSYRPTRLLLAHYTYCTHLRPTSKAPTYAQRIMPTMYCSFSVVKHFVRSIHVTLVRHATSYTDNMCWCTSRRNMFTVRTNQSSYNSNPHERSRANRVPKRHPVRITGGESVYVRPCRTHHTLRCRDLAGTNITPPQRMYKQLQLHFFHS